MSEPRPTARKLEEEVQAALASLESLSTQSTRDGMARYGIYAEKTFGTPIAGIQKVAKRLGRDHDLAEALWATGWYEARLLASYVGEPERVTPAQMDQWCRDFDNWGVCDTVCFNLFDRTPHAFSKVEEWHDQPEEFVKRAAFALLACLALHDKKATDEPFLQCLPLVERAATDERNFVKKGVLWALRLIGERNPDLFTAAVTVAERLSASSEAAARWVGKNALRELKSPAATKRLARKR